jgi:hypothetical protein
MPRLPPELRLEHGVAGPHGHHGGVAQIDAFKTEVEDSLSLVELIQLNQGGVFVNGRQLDQAEPSFSLKSQRRSSTRTRASSDQRRRGR